MTYIDKLHQIDNLQTFIKECGPISVELLNKINYKLRLEWNYTSNSIEGNTLTKRETRTVMVGLVDVNDKPIKDVMEIRNHDKVITTIMKMGKGELNISESRIKEIHKGIMYEEDPEKQKQIGQWKSTNNYLYNFNGERFDFIDHSDVKDHIHQLVNWVNAEKEKIEANKKGAVHPVILAFKFHLDYLTIHPFYDGNGRTARILSNLILISYGYPPLYINENEKQNYHRYLTDIQSYGGEPDLFFEFMADLLLRSMQIITNTIEGKSIEEDDDFIKEIQLLKTKGSSKNIPRSPKFIYNAFKTIEKDIWENIKITLKHFESLFNESQSSCSVNNRDPVYDSINLMASLNLFQKLNEPTKTKIFGHDIYENDITTISWKYKLIALNGAEIPVDFKISLTVKFNPRNYHVDLMTSANTPLKSIYKIEKSYGSTFLPEEIGDMNDMLKKHLVDEIKDRMGE